MKIKRTDIEGVLIIEPRVFEDARGFFYESYHEAHFRASGIPTTWVQDNHARSVRNTVRGLHFQRGAGQAKLVRCIRGTIWDVVADLRPGSPTYGQWHGLELSEGNWRIFYVPEGFAHGYAVLSDVADVLYKCSRLYDPELETGIRWDDPSIGVQWPVASPLLSQRDCEAPTLEEYLERERAAGRT